MLDGKLLGISGLGLLLHIFRLIDRHRGQGAQLFSHHPHEIPGALGGTGGDLIQLAARSLHASPEALEVVAVRGQQIDLIGSHDHGPVAQVHAVIGQLVTDGVKVLYRVSALAAGHIHNMNQQPAAVNVPQEIMAQARTLSRTLNDTGDIRHDEGHALIHIDDAQVGEQRGEMVVCDLRPGIGGDGKEGGFSNIGEAHKANVCQKLELQDHIPLLALHARLGEAGNLTGRGSIVGIAPAAPAALSDDKVLAGGHVHNDLVGLRIPDHGAPGDLDNQGLSTLAAHIPAQAVHTCLGGVLPLITEIQQCGKIVIDPQDHAAAMAAVAAVGTAGGHIFFPVEGHGAIAAPSAADCNSNLIYKHCLPPWFHGG